MFGMRLLRVVLFSTYVPEIRTRPENPKKEALRAPQGPDHLRRRRSVPGVFSDLRIEGRKLFPQRLDWQDIATVEEFYRAAPESEEL
jgi:hypothetical protein